MVRQQKKIKDKLEEVIDEMVSKGIYWSEAASQFEKLFILRAPAGQQRQPESSRRDHGGSPKHRLQEDSATRDWEEGEGERELTGGLRPLTADN